MKKNFFYALMSAIALTGAIGFTACSSDSDAVVENNPTYDGNSVRTDFAFSISSGKMGGTRMTADNVQATVGAFHGMTDMYLIPFDGVPGVSGTKNSINPEGTADQISNYPLGAITSGLSTSQSSKVYSLTLPVGTDNFLFYAKAKRDASDPFAQGKLASSFYNGDGSKKNGAEKVKSNDEISFDLVSIQTSLGDDATKIAAYLTAIANASYTPSGESPIKWSDTPTKAATDGTYSSLAKLYNQFTSNYNARSGSAESVVRMILDLYKGAYAINEESSVADIKGVAKAICQKIETATNGVYVKIKNGSDVIDIDATTPVASTTADSWTAEASGFVASFPANLSLPMGAAQLKWDTPSGGSANEFMYIDNPYYSAGVSLLEAYTALDKYCYPSELLYFDNSPLRATSDYKKESDYPVTVVNWDALYQADTWPDTEVKATTRAVAMTNNVNYGVAMLQTDVKLAATSLTDNMSGIVGGAAEDQTITAVETNKDIANKKSIFKVTGLLIGGQPDNVGWNMVETNPSGSFTNVIYDKNVTFAEEALKTAATNTNYTLVFDNYDDSKSPQSDVLIALQVVNDGCDFYGANGLIPAGSTFYLAGKLELATKTWTKATRNNATTYRVTHEDIKRVFCQDYTTVANITIAADGLKRAYSTIPDLRSTEVLFGLSVDLKWEAGLTFTVNM